MTYEHLKLGLRRTTASYEPGFDCPEAYTLASYLEGGLSERGHRHFERHLADCDYCIERVGLLGRAQDSELESLVPELVLIRSRKLVNSRQSKPNHRLRHARSLTAAAMVVLAFGLLINLDSPNRVYQKPTLPGGSPDQIRQERNIDHYAMVPTITSPLENARINPLGQQFTWIPVRDSLYYQVRIVSEMGDLVWQERVNSTNWRLPGDLSLSTDSEYFVRVDAYLTESKSVNSDYVVFKVKSAR